MNVSYIILGVVMIGIGVIFIKIQIRSYRKGEKDTLGIGMRTLVGGIGLVICGIVVIIKAFSG
jgi:hypothetical protein